MSSIVAGQTVSWTVRAQGVRRKAEGVVIAVCDSGESPKNRWPKGLKQPENRELLGFDKPRQMAYAIVKETMPDGQIIYRTPRLQSGLVAA
ncbi:MAG TPA: hypothetical protein PKV97_00375 [Thauera aminoaromatica]|nr:hypothetical protein [Thauera aminoaromatica]